MSERKTILIFREILGSNKGVENYNYWNIKLHYSTGVFDKIIFVTSDTNIVKEDFNQVEFDIKNYYQINKKTSSKFYKLLKLIVADLKFLWLLISNRDKQSILLNVYGLKFYEVILLSLIRIVSRGKVYILLHDLKRLDEAAFDPSLNVYKRLEYSLIYKLVDTILVHSIPIIDAIKSNNLPTGKVTFLPHWDFPSFMDDAPALPSKRITTITNSNAEVKFLFIGQINHNKGLGLLLKAVNIAVNKQAKNFKIFIFGKSKKTFSTAVLHDYIKEHNLEDHVLFMDEFVPENEMTPIISACDVLLIPYTYIYNSGSILRFLAYRKPILYSDLPSFQELLSGYEVGRSFKNNDENDFSEAIISLLSDKDLNKYKDQINLWFESKYDFNEHVGYLKAIMA